MKDNLYIIGFPRGMTTLTYELVVKAIGGGFCDLKKAAGEFLNHQRPMETISDFHENYRKQNHQFWTNNTKLLQLELLNQLHDLKSFWVVKDVLFPHITAEFVKQKKAKTLIIKKDIPLTAYSCFKKGWDYPTRILPEDSIVRHKHDIVSKAINLMKSFKYLQDTYLKPLAKESYVRTVNAEEITRNPDILWQALEELGYEPNKFDYRDYIKPGVEKVKGYKESTTYKIFNKLYEKIKDE